MTIFSEALVVVLHKNLNQFLRLKKNTKAKIKNLNQYFDLDSLFTLKAEGVIFFQEKSIMLNI